MPLLLKPLRVVTSEDDSSFRRFVFNLSISLEEIKEEICDVFEVNSNNCKLHDFFSGRAYIQLDTVEYLKEPLKDMIQDMGKECLLFS